MAKIDKTLSKMMSCYILQPCQEKKGIYIEIRYNIYSEPKNKYEFKDGIQTAS